MTALAAFVGGLILFFGMHFFTTFRSRDADSLVERMGRSYKGLYSVLSLVGFVAMVWGFDSLRPWPQIWRPPEWTHHIAMTLMLPVFVLLVAAYAPGGYIKRLVRHPMLTAIMLWALAHLTANGDLGGIILFGAFLIYSAVDRMVVAKREVPPAQAAEPNIFGDLISVAVGVAAYPAFLFYLHPVLFGVAIVF
ncbi:MAG TPA: NnrU family protein [Hyphomonadaceae bacterium]|nr:NnrU family protein [Hyphomonadaceae bacterium]